MNTLSLLNLKGCSKLELPKNRISYIYKNNTFKISRYSGCKFAVSIFDAITIIELLEDVLNNNILNSEDYDNTNTHMLISFKKGKDENELIAKIEVRNFYKIINCSEYKLRTYELNARNDKMNDYLKSRFTFTGELSNFNMPYDFVTWKQLKNNKSVTVKTEIKINPNIPEGFTPTKQSFNNYQKQNKPTLNPK